MSPECKACGGHVSKEFQRVASDNDGDVHACLSCADKNTVALEAAGIDDDRIQRGSTGYPTSRGYNG